MKSAVKDSAYISLYLSTLSMTLSGYTSNSFVIFFLFMFLEFRTRQELRGFAPLGLAMRSRLRAILWATGVSNGLSFIRLLDNL